MMDALYAAVRAEPADAGHRAVLQDALLAAADPRGRLMADPADEAAWRANLDRIRADVPEATRICVRAGLLVEIDVPADGVHAGLAACLAREPLAQVGIAAIQGLTASQHAILGAARGLMLRQAVKREDTAAWVRAMDAVRPGCLALTVDGQPPKALAWPWLTHLAIGGEHASRWIPQLPSVRHLRVEAPDTRHLWAAERLPDLEHLDLRGLATPAPAVRWAEADPRRSLRHHTITPGPRSRLDDVFETRGRIWREHRAPVCAAIAPGSLCAIGVGTQIRLFDVDHPTLRADCPAEITALSAHRMGVIAGTIDGDLIWWTLDGAGRRERLPGAIRAIATHGADVCVLYDGGWWLEQGGAVHQDSAPVHAIALTAAGHATGLGDTFRFAVGPTDARTLAAGAPVTGASPLAGGWIIRAGRRVWQVMNGQWTQLDARAFASDGRVMTRISAAGLVTSDFDGTEVVTAYGGDPKPVAVAALASGAVLAVFESGAANLLHPDGALKLDEFPGERRRDWVFVHAGQILMAR